MRFWIDLTRPREWRISLAVSRLLWKIKDYDRLESDYCNVLCHATDARMSKPNYELNTVYSIIDEAQSNCYYSIVRDDINNLINEGATMAELKEYVNNLTDES